MRKKLIYFCGNSTRLTDVRFCWSFDTRGNEEVTMLFISSLSQDVKSLAFSPPFPYSINQITTQPAKLIIDLSSLVIWLIPCVTPLGVDEAALFTNAGSSLFITRKHQG